MYGSGDSVDDARQVGSPTGDDRGIVACHDQQRVVTRLIGRNEHAIRYGETEIRRVASAHSIAVRIDRNLHS